MDYTSHEIVEKTGVPLRTIRLWVSRGLVPKPRGKGTGTRYLEEHRVLIRTVAEYRKAGVHNLGAIRKRMRETSFEQKLAFIGEAKPAPAPPAEPQRKLQEQANEGEALALPASASRISVVPLLPQLALMIGEGASPVVQRIAAEICQKYGQG
jgi:DNA-binding transcriptional MerR regulator